MSLYEFYMRMSSNGRAPASQAGDAGSIPVIRSKKQLQNHLVLQLIFYFNGFCLIVEFENVTLWGAESIAGSIVPVKYWEKKGKRPSNARALDFI